jgi:hypothetical protein
MPMSMPAGAKCSGLHPALLITNAYMHNIRRPHLQGLCGSREHHLAVQLVEM